MDPVSDELILSIVEYGVYALAIIVFGFSSVFAILFWKGNNSHEVTKYIQPIDYATLAAIILIIISMTILSLKGIVKGDAAVAILSGIAGYVLGGFQRSKQQHAGPTESDNA